MQTLIPLSLINELRCYNCEKFISCGPVHVIPNGPEGSNFCGRCHFLAKSIYQNKAFEILGSMFTYPCCYWERCCSANLQWASSLEHEWKCSYQGCCSRFWRHPMVLFCSGRRELPYGGDIKHVPVHDKILEHLTCVLCHQYLSCDPVYIQSNGKNICHRCIYANGVPKNCIRNRAYELLSCIVIFPCIYRNFGCPTRLKFGRDLWEHESGCSYSNVMTKSPARASQTIPQRQSSFRNNKNKSIPQNQHIDEPDYHGRSYQTPQRDIPVNHRGYPDQRQPNEAPPKEARPQAGYPSQQSHQNQPKQAPQKERGVIQTHSGHYYGTITPQNIPFAPPTEKNEFDVNKELLKSMKKREERKFARAEDIEGHFDRIAGENDSVCTEESYKNYVYDRHSSSGESRSEDGYHHQRTKPRDSGYYTPNNNKVPIATIPAHHVPQPAHNVSRNNSFQYPTTAVGTHDPRINQPRRNHLKKNNTPSPEPFAFPVDEMNAINLSRSESINSNKDFLVELKRKQERIKSGGAIKESPYHPRY